MKKLLIRPGTLLFFLVGIADTAIAQLTITPGAQFVLTGGTQLTLANSDFVNQGIFSAGNANLLFTGNAVNTITGSQNTTLYDLTVFKTSGALKLLVPLAVTHQVNFTSGLLDLNTHNLDLGTTGILNGEKEASHVVAFNGGEIIFTNTFNAPAAVNPANLGLVITSAQNLGNTIIKRGEQSQTNISGNGSSVLRYYDVKPVNNTSLNATLRFNYFTAELNGLDENNLVYAEKQAPADWKFIGFDARNISGHYVDKNNVASLGMLTLSSVNNALPVRFISFNTQCNGNAVFISWKTAQEINSGYYLVEKSADGVQWNTIGTIAAAGSAVVQKEYSYVDNSVPRNSYYRIVEYDLDGKTTFTGVLRAACNSQDVFRVWPNPASDVLYIHLSVRSNSGAVIRLFDSKGALIKQQVETLTAGNQLFNLQLKGIATGLYFVTVTYNHGEQAMQKIMKN